MKKILLLTALLFLKSMDIGAQAFCSGAACSSLPISESSLNSLLFGTKFQYTDKLANEMARATEAGNLLGLPTGAVSLEKSFTLGTSMGLGYEEKHNTVIVTEFGSFTGIDSGGVSVSPKFFMGMNLGRALNTIKREEKKFNSSSDDPLSLNRFDVYLYYFNRSFSTGAQPKPSLGNSLVYNENVLLENPNADPSTAVSIDLLKGLKFKDQNKFSMRTNGIFTRYRLLDSDLFTIHRFVRFLGVSLGMGYYESKTKLNIIQASTDINIRLAAGSQMTWNSFGLANYYVFIQSFPVEVSSGFKLFNYINATLGVGGTYNRGKLDMSYLRYGNAYLNDGNVFALLCSTSNSYLGLQLRSESSIRKFSMYLKPGIEFDIPYFKLGFEGIITQEAEGLNFWLRTEF